MLKAVTVTIHNSSAFSDELVPFSVTCSLDEAFTLLSMPAFDGLVVCLVPEYTDALPVVPTEEEE